MLSKVRSMLSRVRLAGHPAMQYPGNTDADKCLDIRGINDLKDEELERLNALLPWAAFVLDRQGRNFGQAYSPKKRNDPQAIPDRRIIELDRRYGLAGKYVLEAGCFEGIHTVGLLQKGATVSAFDGRIANVVKTLVRCWAFDVYADVLFWNLAEDRPRSVSIECDILHHVGALYHLMDPIGVGQHRRHRLYRPRRHAGPGGVSLWAPAPLCTKHIRTLTSRLPPPLPS